MTKICNKCKTEYFLTFYNKRPLNKDGLHGSCKNCTRQYVKEYSSKNKESKLRRDKIWRDKNREKIKSYDKKAYTKHKQKK